MVRLLDKRLLINTGKGGVGKSTLSSALAVLAARKGKRVLLVESDTKTDTFGRIHEIFQVPELGHEEREIFPNLFACSLNPDKAFEDYVVSVIRVRALFRAVFERDIIKNAYHAAPGAAEMLLMLKIWVMATGQGSGRRPYDLVVYDAPATGHGLFFLKIPQVLIDVLGAGPLPAKAKQVLSLLNDPARTRLNLITLPMEMPVTETLEFLDKIRSGMEVELGAVFLNALQEQTVGEDLTGPFERLATDRNLQRRLGETLCGTPPMGEALVRCTEQVRLQHTRQQLQAEKLRGADAPLVEVPFIHADRFDKTTILAIAHCLEGLVS